MDDRDILRQMLIIVMRRTEIPPDVAKEANQRIAAIPEDKIQDVRRMIYDSRDVLRGGGYLDDGVVQIVTMACDRAAIKGFEKGIYVGGVRGWAYQPENAPALVAIAQEILALIDRYYPPRPTS